MPDSPLDSESDLVPDPRRDAETPWDMYGLGIAGIGVLVVGWWAGSSTGGGLRMACRLLAVLGGLYGLYVIGLAGGWRLISRGVDRWMSRVGFDVT